MNQISLKQMAEWAGGALIQGVPSDCVGAVSTDTRKLSEGDTFLALKGDNFDGHEFVKTAQEVGVAAIIVSNFVKDTESFEGGIIHVRDTLVALQMLAKNYRESLDIFAIGVTGSNGKTSTKDFLKTILAKAGPVNATLGNLNNHIGLPLTILNSTDEHKFGVWEMGMNHPGEIEVLADIAAPNAGIITNIGTAHIEHMKTREAIAEEKGQLAEMVESCGFFVMPANDDFAEAIAGRSAARMIAVGIGEGDVQAGNLIATGEGTFFDVIAGGKRVSTSIRVAGEHMVMNALLGVAVALELGVDLETIGSGLSEAELTRGRLQRREVNGVQFIDDSYNANPDSMRAALKTLSSTETAGRRIAVLGFMGELGEHEEAEHKLLGEAVAEAGVDLLVTVSEKAKLIAESGGSDHAFDDHEAAGNFLKSELKPGDLVLVKGSRAATMEKVIEQFSK